MKRLEEFPGFEIGKRSKKEISFNPFEFSTSSTHRITSREEPQKEVEAPVQRTIVSKKFINVLESKEEKETEFVALFPKKEEPVAPIPEQNPEGKTPMIQPRSTDGQRMLYKYPDIPKVGPRGSYWLLVGTEDRYDHAWLVQFDGAANPNPGPASSGAVLWSPKDLDGKRNVVFESGKYLGRATNNIAEAQGLLLALQIAAARGAREILIEGDSELIVYQNIRKYKVSDKNLKVWWSTAQAAMMDETAFDWIAIRQVPREQNERADSITKEVLSKKESFVR